MVVTMIREFFFIGVKNTIACSCSVWTCSRSSDARELVSAEKERASQER